MSKDNGGPAFPYSGIHKGEKENMIVDSHGMTLRDYFAAKAMAAIVRRWDGYSFGGGPNSPQNKELSEDAYLIAEAMLKAREVE
ncbi:hypothetical protein PGO13_19980 [Klebsiella aerogenes]